MLEAVDSDRGDGGESVGEEQERQSRDVRKLTCSRHIDARMQEGVRSDPEAHCFGQKALAASHAPLAMPARQEHSIYDIQPRSGEIMPGSALRFPSAHRAGGWAA